MTAEQKAHVQEWVAALRSGKYKQGRKLLNYRNDEYCCLGVACEIAIAHGEPVKKEGIDVFSYNGQASLLPPIVMNFFGLNDPWGGYGLDGNENSLGFGSLGSGSLSLTHMNDSGKTFAEIADVIESNPAEMFVKEAA